jgi:hypothetical protein
MSKAQLMEAFASVPGVRTLQDVVSYAMANKSNAVMVGTTIASAGYAISDLFSPADKADPEVRALATELAVIEQRAVRARIDGVASTSETLKGVSGSKQDLVLLRDILQWARGHYGSASAAKHAFGMQQAFFELSSADVDVGFELLV